MDDNTNFLKEMIGKVKYQYEYVGNVLRFKIISPIPNSITLRYSLLLDNKAIFASAKTNELKHNFIIYQAGDYKVKYYLFSNDYSVSASSEIIRIESVPTEDIENENPLSNGKVSYFEFGNSKLEDNYSNEEMTKLLGINDSAYFCTRVNPDDFLLGNVLGINLSLPFSWKFDESVNRDVVYRFQCFSFQSALMIEYWKTGNETYRTAFIDLVFDWIDKHKKVDMNDTWAWHDDATARRACFFIVTLLLFEKMLSKKQITVLYESISMHIRLLCHEDFYKYHHNHGMYQDRAVALYGLTYSEDPEYHLMMAMERSKEYFEFAFTEDGVHKEHSPMYHMDMAYSISWFKLAFRDFSPEFSKSMDQLLKKMSDYIVWITMPNREIPSIGDSPKRSRIMPLWVEDSNYKYLLTNGSSGIEPNTKAKVFWEAGYGIIRKDWSINDNSTWMMLLAATHSMAHKHNDDLSFLLYHKGELFVEAGNRNYNYAEPMTEYIYSSYAHNVLLINGEGWKMKPNHLPLLEPEAFETKILDSCTEGQIQYVTGVQTRFTGIRQKRTLKYYRQSEIVHVIDSIKMDENAPLRLIYHLASGLEIIQDSKFTMIKRNDIPIAKIHIDATEAVSVNWIFGDDDERIKPWIFNGKPNPQYGAVLVVDIMGRKGDNTISLLIELL